MGDAVSKEGWLTQAAEHVPEPNLVATTAHAAAGNAKQAGRATAAGFTTAATIAAGAVGGPGAAVETGAALKGGAPLRSMRYPIRTDSCPVPHSPHNVLCSIL